MFKIVNKKVLNPTVTLMDIYAPRVAKKALPGQFIILRTDEDGERIQFYRANDEKEEAICRFHWRGNRLQLCFQNVGHLQN